MNPLGREFIYLYIFMCNELFHNDNVIVKHDLIYYLFFLLCVGSFEVKYIICKCPIYLYKKKAKRKKLHLWEIYVLLQSETSFYIIIFIFRYPYQNENCVFFAIFIFVCGMKYQCVKKKIFDGKKLQKTSKGKKTSFSQRKPHIKTEITNLKRKSIKNDLNFLSLMWLHFTELTSKVFILSVHGDIWCLQPS